MEEHDQANRTPNLYESVKAFSARVNVSERTVFDWIRKRGLPCIKVCGIRRIITNQADAWLVNDGAPVVAQSAVRASTRSRSRRS